MQMTMTKENDTGIYTTQ